MTTAEHTERVDDEPGDGRRAPQAVPPPEAPATDAEPADEPDPAGPGDGAGPGDRPGPGDGAEPGDGAGPPGLLGRVAWVGAPLSIYLVTRIVQFWLLDWMLPPGSIMRDKLLAWDASWFARVAAEGYPTSYQYSPEGELLGSSLAFFPGYPGMIKAVAVTTGLEYTTAAIALAWLAGAVVAVLLCALATRLWDRRVALALVALVCVQPMSVVFTMAYSEPVFLAFVLGSLLAAHRHRWIAAGLLGAAAGLTRPTGAALALALVVAAVMHVSRREHGPRRWWALAGAAFSCLGVPAYLAWVALRLGEPTAWFKVQTAGWGTSFDFGATVSVFIRDALRAGDGWVQVSVALMLIAAVGLAVIAVWLAFRGRVWPPLVVYGLVALALVVGQAGYYHSKPRLLVPVLLTLVPVALALGRARPRTAVAALAGFGLFGLWYGSYMIMVWRYAI